MTGGDVGSLITGTVAFVGGSVAVVRWIRSDGMRDQKIDELLKKVTPNGGDSDELGDRVKRTEEKVTVVVEELRGLSRRLDKHLGFAESEGRALARFMGKTDDRLSIIERVQTGQVEREHVRDAR